MAAYEDDDYNNLDYNESYEDRDDYYGDLESPISLFLLSVFKTRFLAANRIA